MLLGALALIGIGLVVIGVVLFMLGVIFAGGAMTIGTMHGMTMTPERAPSAGAGASVASTPIWQASQLVFLAIFGGMVYAVFFRGQNDYHKY